MLYVIATPIGNLEDITYRAIRILSECDYLLCEDTRKTNLLLTHYQIKKKKVSFNAHNEKEKEEKILEDLEKGKKVGLVSDAGTPLLSDPGLSLLQRCQEKNIPILSLPGACSIIQACVVSAMKIPPFQFVGFLPKKEGEKEKTLKRYLHYEGVTIAFDSPLRILKTLTLLQTLDPTLEVAIAREMTKKFEEVKKGTPQELYDYFSHRKVNGHPKEANATKVKGEITLVFGKGHLDQKDLSIEDLISLLTKEGLSTKEAIKQAAKLLKKPKREIYLSHLKKIGKK